MKKWFGLVCIILLSFFAIRPLLAKGYFPMHDDTQVARVVVMGHALRDGQFPVRIVSDLGYGLGYPIFNFYGPLPYYVGGLLYNAGIDSVTATKLMFGLGAVIAPITLFAFLFPVFGTAAALTGALLFLFAPYHAVQMYVRGAVGEYWAIAFVPLILLGLQHAMREKKLLRGIAIGGVALAATITSHTIFGFLTCLGLGSGTIVYWIVRGMRKKLVKQDIAAPVGVILLGLVLSAFFWLPAFFEMSATSVSAMVSGASTTFFDHFVCISQLWNSPWGFAGSASGCVDGMSFKFGKFHVMVAVLSLLIWFVMRINKRIRQKNLIMTVACLSLAVCVFLMLPIASPVWRLVPDISFIQYPWRLLAFGMMGIAICGAYLISVIRIPAVRIFSACCIIAAAIMINAKIFVPQYQYERSASAFESFEELRFTKSKISDEYLPSGIIKPKDAGDVVKSALTGETQFSVRRFVESSVVFTVELESAVPQNITLRKAWFPGWELELNGVRIKPVVRQGLLSLNIPSGISIIEGQFRDTPVRILGNVLSIAGVILLGVIYIYGKKAKN